MRRAPRYRLELPRCKIDVLRVNQPFPGRSMTGLPADLRYAARVLLRSPWLAGLAVVTMAVGIGANTALFSLLDAVLLKGLPYREPHRLVAVWGQDGARTGMRLPIPLFEVLRDRSRTIQGFTTHNVVGGALATREGPVRVSGQRVSPNFVELMGIPPRAGRGFRPEEGDPGAPAVLVVAHGFWQRHLEGDPEAIGTTLFIEGVPYVVVGIMPPTFRTYLGGTDFCYALRQRRCQGGVRSATSCKRGAA